MQVEGPDRFTLSINPGDSPPFEVRDANGATKFSGRAASRLPKLYVVTAGALPIYVGITRQSMRARLRYGWSASGQGGYHGYPFRDHHTEATLDVWYQVDPPVKSERPEVDIETVEAELATSCVSTGSGRNSKRRSTFTRQTRDIARSLRRSGLTIARRMR